MPFADLVLDRPDHPAVDGALLAADHARRGVALLAADRPAEALPALLAAVTAGDATPMTLLNLALAEDRAGNRAHAQQRMRDIAGLLPNWDEPVLRLAASLRADRDMAAAEQAYEAVLAVNPRREEALVSLGVLRLGSGDAEGAMTLLLRCCAIAPNNAEAWDALGLAVLQTGDAIAALEAFAEARRLVPRWLDPALHMVDAACAAGAAEAELARLECDALADPLDPVGATARGVLLERLGRRDAAIDALEVAVTLAPDAARPTALLAGVLTRTTRVDEAEKWLRRAAELDPDEPRLRNDHAAVLMRLHRHAEARDELTELIAAHGEQVGALCNLATATVCCGLQAEAVVLAERAIALAQDATLPRRALVNALPYRDGVTGAELLAALVACSDRVPRAVAPVFDNIADPDRRLRIGLLSGSLRTHPVGWLTIAGFESLDPAAFEIVVLAQHAARDAMARRFRAIARSWHDVDALDDAGIAALGRSLGIDVLIDLGGYGDAGRMLACAHRVAPVQIKWVGMQNHSSGLAEMDWFLTDRWETPAGFEKLYSERLLRLPDGYICYSPPPYAPDIVPLPALANGYVTFGCFNNLAKITPRAIATWATILRRMPSSRLILKTHQFADAGTAERIHAAFDAHGIPPARVELRGASRHRIFLGEYNQIDIVLDPFPYSGGLTTCEALWMGVPTVTLPGEIFASRHSASHLSNAGLADWMANDIDGYIDLAVARASDLPALAALRAGLRPWVKASPLCDAPRFGRNFGAALRLAWRDWCASRG
jgi:predicted O-linked N-acetylglucosamine transferase (SPINDLY family)